MHSGVVASSRTCMPPAELPNTCPSHKRSRDGNVCGLTITSAQPATIVDCMTHGIMAFSKPTTQFPDRRSLSSGLSGFSPQKATTSNAPEKSHFLRVRCSVPVVEACLSDVIVLEAAGNALLSGEIDLVSGSCAGSRPWVYIYFVATCHTSSRFRPL